MFQGLFLARNMNDFALIRHLMTLVLVSGAISCQEEIVSEPELLKEERELIARVNGLPVFRSDFEEYLALSDEESDGEVVGSRFQHFLVQLILFQDAEREGFRVPEELARERTSEWGVISEADTVLAHKWNQRFLTVQGYIRSRLDEGSQISLNELRAYYVEHEQEFLVNERLRVLEILVKERPLANHLLTELEPGDFRTFRELAERHSVGTHDHGELGVFEPGQLPSVFEQVIFSLKVGKIGPVFSSQFGYHIFSLEERTPKHYQKFYEVQEQIFELLVAERERGAVEAFVQARIRGAEIEILDEGLESSWRNRNAGLG